MFLLLIFSADGGEPSPPPEGTSVASLPLLFMRVVTEGGGEPPVPPPPGPPPPPPVIFVEGVIEHPYEVKSQLYTLATNYFVLLRDFDSEVAGIFVDWVSLYFSEERMQVGEFSFTLTSASPYIDNFKEDYIFEVYRQIPGLDVPWYRCFAGFIQYTEESIEEDGRQIFIAKGVGLNSLISRTNILYTYATVKAYKLGLSETVIKEYVHENCGTLALMGGTTEREADGVIPNFYVEEPYLLGTEYEGDNAFTNLLETIREIAKKDNIHFWIDLTHQINSLGIVKPTFTFRARQDRMANDRSAIYINPATGLNQNGYIPTIFSVAHNNVARISRIRDHIAEANRVAVFGPGDGAVRSIMVLENYEESQKSPWGRKEISRQASEEFESQRREQGVLALDEAAPREYFEVTPLQVEDCAFGKHYLYGDRVTIRHNGEMYHVVIAKYSITVEQARQNMTFLLEA